MRKDGGEVLTLGRCRDRQSVPVETSWARLRRRKFAPGLGPGRRLTCCRRRTLMHRFGPSKSWTDQVLRRLNTGVH